MESKKFRNRKLLEYAWKVRGLIISGLFITVVSSLTELLGPYIISKILDGALVEGKGAEDYKYFLTLVLAYFASMMVVVIVRYLMSLNFGKLSNLLATIIRKDVFEHVMSLPVKFFDKYAVGKISNRITNDTQDIRLLFQIVFMDIFTTLVLALGLIVGLFLVNVKLGLLTLISLPFAYVIFKDYIGKSNRFNSDFRRYRSEMNGNINETIETMEVVQAFNNEDYIYDQFSDLNDKVYAENKKLALLWSYSSGTATRSLGDMILAIATTYFMFSHLGGSSFFTVGSLYIFIEYNRKLYQYINQMNDRIEELEKAKSAADQVFEFLRQTPQDVGSQAPADIEGNIRFDHVTFAYNDEEYVLNNIDLEINKGQSAAFVGHTGSGKSTIMNLIYGFYKVNKGHIYIDGQDIQDLNMEAVRKNMAIVFQNPYIFEGSIYENITLFDKSISKSEAELALISVGGENILAKDKGIDHHIREGGKDFSAGEKQLISFARAMVRNPKILVLDEATANVDSQTENYIQFGVNRLKKGRTTLIIAHRLSTIKDVDKIYVLDQGSIIEEGDHDQLIAKGGVYAHMYLES